MDREHKLPDSNLPLPRSRLLEQSTMSSLLLMLLDLVLVLLLRALDSPLEILARKLNSCSDRALLLFLYVSLLFPLQFLPLCYTQTFSFFMFTSYCFASLRTDIQGAFNQITSTLDEKTRTDSHPGIVSQATSAFQTGVHKVDDFLNDVSPSPTGQ